MIYSPFEKELEKIDEVELQKLIDHSISEGWYIEYKRDLPKYQTSQKIDNLKIAKSIGAFANTQGGWLFYGVESDGKNLATKLCGIDLNEYKNLPDQVSRIIAANIVPKPIYHFKTVELSNNRHVFIIKVEESPTPPYITSQGIIYQRENNENNPVKDRYIIEKLTEKAENYYESIEQFCNSDYGETKGQSEDDQPWLELYLFPKPFGHFNFKDFYSSDFFKKTADIFYSHVDCTFDFGEHKKSLPLTLNFNSIYSSQNSLIIRPLRFDNLIYKTPTVELFDDGNLKFLMPLSHFNSERIPEHYKYSELLTNFLENYGLYDDFKNHIRMIDGVDVIYRVMLILAMYRLLLEESEFNLEASVGFRGRITNTWRKFVFFDSKDYIEKLKQYNIPLSPKDEIEIPRFKKGNHYTIDINDHHSFIVVGRFVLEAIGLPDSLDINLLDIIRESWSRFEST